MCRSLQLTVGLYFKYELNQPISTAFINNKCVSPAIDFLINCIAFFKEKTQFILLMNSANYCQIRFGCDY